MTELTTMQCPQCKSRIDLSSDGTAPSNCPECGAPIEEQLAFAPVDVAAPVDEAAPEFAAPVATAAPVVAAAPARRSLFSLGTILATLLIVVLATLTALSTMAALRVIAERDKLQTELTATSQGYRELVTGIATTPKLKGFSLEPVRAELLGPASNYYQLVLSRHGADPAMRPQVAEAKLRLAAIQAKLKMPQAVTTLADGMGVINQMSQDPELEAADYPSLQQCALQVAAPTEWMAAKGVDMQSQGIQLFFTLSSTISTYKQLSAKFSQVPQFRDDLAALLKISGMLQGLANRNDGALAAWTQARDVLETLVRDQPTNADFQTRLLESLANAGRLERAANQNEEAVKDYQRAVEVREQMLAASPDDQKLKDELARSKRDLERAQAAVGKQTAAAGDAPPAPME